MSAVAQATAPVAGRTRDGHRSAPDLERRLRSALRFASAALDDFGESGYQDAERSALSFAPEKIIAEATMFAYAAHACTANPDVGDDVHALATRLARSARSSTALADFALRPDRVFKRAVPHVILSAMGFPDEAFDDFAADRTLALLAFAADVPATAMAERAWVCELWGRFRDMPAFPRAPYALDPGPFDLRGDARGDAYGLTHQLFYVTDFGRASRPSWSREPDDVLADVDGLVARYLDYGDYDLLAELLMAWPQLHTPWSPASAFAFRVLREVEDEVGVLPCGNVDPTRLASLDGAERTRYARATSYHTAFVMGFLCAVTLRDGRMPEIPVAAVTADWRSLRTLVHDDDTSQWLGCFDRASEYEKSALAPLLADIVISQALRRGDFARVAAALQTAITARIPPTRLQNAAVDQLTALGRATALRENRALR